MHKRSTKRVQDEAQLGGDGDPVRIVQEIEICHSNTDQRVKIKENKKNDKFLELTRKLKKLWNIKLTVIAFLVGTSGMILKCMVNWLVMLEIEVPTDTNKTTVLLTSAWNLRRILEIWKDLLSLTLQGNVIS